MAQPLPYGLLKSLKAESLTKWKFPTTAAIATSPSSKQRGLLPYQTKPSKPPSSSQVAIASPWTEFKTHLLGLQVSQWNQTHLVIQVLRLWSRRQVQCDPWNFPSHFASELNRTSEKGNPCGRETHQPSSSISSLLLLFIGMKWWVPNCGRTIWSVSQFELINT